MSSVEEQIRSYLAGELSPDEARALRECLRDDDEARAIYDRHATLLSAASQREASREEGVRVWQAIEGALDQPVARASAPARAPIWRWVPALVGVLLVAGMVLAVVRPEPEVSIKGGSDGALVADVDFDIFAIRKGTAGKFSKPRLVAAGDTLTMDDYIQLRYRSGEATLQHLYLGAVTAADDKGSRRVIFYYPRPGMVSPLKIVPRPRLEPVGRSIKLAARHRPGKLTLFALFAEQAPSDQQARQALRRAVQSENDQLSEWSGKVVLLRKSYRLVEGGATK